MKTIWKECRYLLNLSGMGDWGEDCSDEQWHEICQGHPELKPFRGTPWIHYQEMGRICGGHSATGSDAEEVEDMCKHETNDMSSTNNNVLVTPRRRGGKRNPECENIRSGRATSAKKKAKLDRRAVMAIEANARTSSSIANSMNIFAMAFAKHVGYIAPQYSEPVQETNSESSDSDDSFA